jgi:hypothetical protein
VEIGITLLSDAQQQTLHSLIDDWIKANPDHYMVAFVRFDEFVNAPRSA